MVRSIAWKRYNWRVIWLSLLYAGFLLPAVYGFKHQLVPHSVAYVVAILPAVPIIGIFFAIGRYLVILAAPMCRSPGARLRSPRRSADPRRSGARPKPAARPVTRDPGAAAPASL